MILGMTTFTAVHVLLSLIGILSELVVLFGLLTANPMNGWTLLFLATTLATSVTGFFFSFHGFTPALGVGILSMFILAATIVARYGFHLAGAWRWVYIVGAVAALYFNSFVLVVQSFLKIPVQRTLAPTGSEPAFAVAQGIVLMFHHVTGFLAVKGFRPAAHRV
ncbi:MAG: hypothetical protein ACLQFT_07805 [Steroidobacteraceae bacterium]|jgi:hypothetical protein|nr:hypothetical protein [Steroidobacteraceae bacterium]